MRPVLYVTTNPLGGPHVSSQVLPYLEALDGRRAHLVTFETDDSRGVATPPPDGVGWTALRHRPPLLGTLRNVAEGRAALRRDARRLGDCILHARSHTAAWMARGVAARRRAPWIFDMRGFYIQERVDNGLLRPDSTVARALRRAERALLADADRVVVLTRRARDLLEEGRFGPVACPVDVVPCGVDLDRFSAGPAPDGPPWRLAYSGTLGPRYLLPEMAAFAAAVARLAPTRLEVATRQDAAPLLERLGEAGFPAADVGARALPFAQVPRFLAGVHAGLLFVRRSLATEAVSPIKLAEYLASGLPVAVSEGMGDASDLVRSEGVGVVVRPDDPDSREEAAHRLVALVEDPATRDRCRRAAEAHFDLESGRAAYRRIYAELDGGP